MKIDGLVLGWTLLGILSTILYQRWIYFCKTGQHLQYVKKQISGIKGKELIFISRIKRDGSGVENLLNKDMSSFNEDTFTLKRLSLTENTYIAIEFNTYVVKIKKDAK